MWEIAGIPIDPARFTPFEPLQVLNYHDGPRIFTCCDADQGLHLACWSDEDKEVARFVVVPCTEEVTHRLLEGTLAVWEALDQPRTWLVDIGTDGVVKSVLLVSLSDIPADALPQPGALLYREAAARSV